MDEKKNYHFENFDVSFEPERRSRERHAVSKTTPNRETSKIEANKNETVKMQLPKMPEIEPKKLVIAAVALLLVVFIVIGLVSCASASDKGNKKNNEDNALSAQELTLENAKISAAQYDYETAISQVKSLEKYATDAELQSLVSSWEQAILNLVEFPHEQITHIFFHSLVYEPELAFDPENGNQAAGYNLVMTTVDEFNKIIQSMYDKGYVMVSMHDICTFDEQGNRVDHKIMLPPDKKAFVLSQDDLNYYHVQDGDGIATKLVIDENGKVVNEYKKLDGSVTYGDFDVVPLIDRFVEKHPDFSYKGHKGILALTGYNGVLGYRTDSVYADINDPNLDPDQIEFLQNNPNFNYEQERAEAKKVADKMKEDGWEFASHTWGHMTVPSSDMDRVTRDTEKWKAYVESIVGKTDVLIFPNGSDLAGTENYDSSIERFNYLVSEGFHMYCPVDSTPYWQQKGDNYFRMSRRNLDGYRMYHDPERCEDLFNMSEVLDKKRPLPVPTMEEIYG